VENASRIAPQVVDHSGRRHAPISNSPSTKYGSIGLMRGEASRRNVPSIATRVALMRAVPGTAICGAFTSRSRQIPDSPRLTLATLQAVGSPLESRGSPITGHRFVCRSGYGTTKIG
jgi:hypothetical protein